MCRDLCLKYWHHKLFASRFGIFHLLLPWLQFSLLQSLWVLPSFLLKIWASALLSKRALFVSVENGRHLTPSLAKISAPPSFVHQSPFSCDSCSSREICLETAPLVKILSFVFCFFPPGLSFSAFFMLTVSREVEMVKFNSEVFSSGDQSFRAATTYFQERVKKANLTINIYEGANHMFW